MIKWEEIGWERIFKNTQINKKLQEVALSAPVVQINNVEKNLKDALAQQMFEAMSKQLSESALVDVVSKGQAKMVKIEVADPEPGPQDLETQILGATGRRIKF